MKWAIIIAAVICVSLTILEINWGRIALWIFNRKLERDLNVDIKRNEKRFKNKGD